MSNAVEDKNICIVERKRAATDEASCIARSGRGVGNVHFTEYPLCILRFLGRTLHLRWDCITHVPSVVFSSELDSGASIFMKR